MRCSELVSLKLDDINFDEKTIKVFGKGKKERITLFGDKAKQSLQLYLDKERQKMVAHDEVKEVFLNQSGNNITTRSGKKLILEIDHPANTSIASI